MTSGFARAIAVACSLFAFAASAAKAEGEVPKLVGRVNDYANKLTPDEVAELDRKLAAYEQESSNEIGFLSVPSLNGEDIESFANRVFKAWGVGQADKNNGILIVYAEAERKYRIEVGYGLEGALPDSLASRIGEEELKPKIRRQTFAALDGACGKIAKAVRGEYAGSGAASEINLGPLVALAVVAVVVLLLSFLHPLVGGVSGAIGGGILAASAFSFGGVGVIVCVVVGFFYGLLVKFILQGMAEGGGGSGYSSGGGSWGGGSFSFGGGDSGGGGASGSAD